MVSEGFLAHSAHPSQAAIAPYIKCSLPRPGVEASLIGLQTPFPASYTVASPPLPDTLNLHFRTLNTLSSFPHFPAFAYVVPSKLGQIP